MIVGIFFYPNTKHLFSGWLYDRDDAREYLRTRRIFKDMDRRCFDAFIEDCLVSCHSDGSESVCGRGDHHLQLAFPPAIEAAIYRNFPLDLNPEASSRLGQYELPARGAPFGWLLYSTEHSIIDRRDLAYLRRRLSSLSFASFDQVCQTPGRPGLSLQEGPGCSERPGPGLLLTDMG